MSKKIMAIATIEILDGKLEQFKEILVELMDNVSKTEPETLIYNWYINEEGTMCQLIEQYANSEAAMFHAVNYAPFKPRLDECRKVQQLVVYGSLDDNFRSMLQQNEIPLFDELMILETRP